MKGVEELTPCGSFCASSRRMKKTALLGPFLRRTGTRPRYNSLNPFSATITLKIFHCLASSRNLNKGGSLECMLSIFVFLVVRSIRQYRLNTFKWHQHSLKSPRYSSSDALCGILIHLVIVDGGALDSVVDSEHQRQRQRPLRKWREHPTVQEFEAFMPKLLEGSSYLDTMQHLEVVSVDLTLSPGGGMIIH